MHQIVVGLGQNTMYPIQKVYEKKKIIKNGSDSLWKYAEEIINQCVTEGILKKQE